ncbi:MAG: sodium:calcium antiporter [Gemmatimonadetes bacterium]|nr:sodium:calcium antiporter [Gemmatimonadota bacterium]NIO32942.1 sodium:calcium antiporter [Gemmatimonadota bacterium]
MFRELVYSLNPLTAWLFFGVCLLAILFSGARLSRYGDVISTRTGLGGAWVGLILLAGVSSAPELVAGLSAILVVGEPDLAVGAALGSCIYNLVIIAVLDFIYRPGTIYSGIRHGHSLSAGFGVILLGAAAAAIFIQTHVTPIGLGPIGPYTIAAPLIYLIAVRSVFFFEREENRVAVAAELVEVSGPRAKMATLTTGRIWLFFGLNALVLVVAATALPVIGEALAVTMGWEETFVGTVFLALVTSVPEVVISIEAVRIGAVDLAIGGILGSNLFDLLILAIEDLAYLDGPLLSAVGSEHVLTAIAALVMTGIAIVGMCSHPTAKAFRAVGWTSLGLLTVGLLSALVLYLIGVNT